MAGDGEGDGDGDGDSDGDGGLKNERRGTILYG
jgi:hypothetical protein